MGYALIGASKENMIGEMRQQLRMGADVNHVVQGMHEGVMLGAAALVYASINGHMPAVTLLIENGADVNKPEPCSGETPLHCAAVKGNMQLMQLLISKGARHDAK